MQNLKGRNSVIARVVACCIVTEFLDDSVDSYLFIFSGEGVVIPFWLCMQKPDDW